MAVRILQSLFAHTLRSVPFGIALLVLIGLYIAVGSGVASVREYFEMDELAFFNAWPLKLLMVLLVATLVCVTLERIPFKPTRWGAWIVHTGIIMLIAGTAYHYRNKIEGSVPIWLGRPTDHYYDRWERALYVRFHGTTGRSALPSLPRFKAYAESLGNQQKLDEADLKDIRPLLMRVNPATGQTQRDPLGQAIGVPSLRMRVVGYWPYANIQDRLITSPSSDATGYWFRLPAEDFGDASEQILVGNRPRYARAVAANLEFEHRPLPNEAALTSIVESARKLHELKIALPGFEQTMNVEVGKRYQLGETGYWLRIEAFDPRWRTMDQQVVQLLTIFVDSPTQKYRRQVISGRDKPTDWKLDEPGVGPMGKRQTEPLDPALAITYTFSDTAQLMPRQQLAQYTLLTTPGSNVTTIIGAGPNHETSVETITGTGKMTITEALPEQAVMMASFTGHKHARRTWSIDLNRQEKVEVETVVEEVPKEKRLRDQGEAGVHQVLQVRASTADGWTQDVLVPFTDAAYELPWRGGLLEVPNAVAPVQLALARNWRPLPARLALKEFKAQAYGGAEARAGAMMRDFSSELSITDTTTGESITGVAKLNEPVFYDGGRWIFFQSGWDANSQQFSVIGVGNRPGVVAMTGGCILILLGILYAFYFKPFLISQMKKRALEAAQAGKPAPRPVIGTPELATQTSHS